MDDLLPSLKSKSGIARGIKLPGNHDVVKLKIRFHDSEFEADGPYNLIKGLYEQFVNAVLFASKEEKISPQAQSFIQRGFDELLSREAIDLFMESERYLRKVRGQSEREWPHLLHEWDLMHPEEKPKNQKDKLIDH